MEIKRVIDGVYWLNGKRRTLVTKSAYSDKPVYGEKIFKYEGKIYREWVPYRSKFAAAFYRGLNGVDIRDSYKVLYLGASSGTTVSHVSDIVGVNGQIYAVEIAEEMAVSLVLLSEERKNIFPIVDDARKPENYSSIVPKCDILYQDVAQRDQTGIFIKNSDIFLKSGKIGMFAIKTRSIDVSLEPREVIRNETQKLKSKFDVIKSIDLYPYQKDHSLLILRKK
ncbi:MAG: fibrillarin-like rRNA/tRNA 2'-O-methyltransferase [Candidatus Parvarchaeota archaeon]|jgi:fibrillarin-like pre-rRNA processing protein|nr:fibrillarin-like rRNA/tRNA 2'-O-methyltransferase [Candidatus Parvarchaeota archaeon]